jgi:hypothetical protein
VVLLIVIGLVIAGTAAHNVSQNAANGNLGGKAPAASYKLGDTAKTSDFQVTVFGVKDPQPPLNQFDQPQQGDRYVSVDLQVTNPGKNQASFSSLLGLHLLDAQNHQYNENIMASLTPSAPDGEIAAGQSIRGFVVFEVPVGVTGGLKLRVQGSVTAAGAVFNLT